MQDLMALKSMGSEGGMTPYEQYMVGYKQSKRPSGVAIADRIIKKPLSTIPAEEIVPGIHALALDVLKDKDGVYNIRRYFGL